MRCRQSEAFALCRKRQGKKGNRRLGASDKSPVTRFSGNSNFSDDRGYKRLVKGEGEGSSFPQFIASANPLTNE